jgi:putative oxidoreductase
MVLRVTRERAIQATFFLLRIVAALLFMEAGALKLFGWFGGVPPHGGGVPLLSQAGVGAVLEVFGGGLMLLGLFARPVAFILAGEMAVAYWQFHAPTSFWPTQNHGQPAILLCFIWLFMAAHGAGDWSVDSWIRARRGKASHTKP